jgi:hypothetical protein
MYLPNDNNTTFSIPSSSTILLAIACLLIIALGIYPGLIMDYL